MKDSPFGFGPEYRKKFGVKSKRFKDPVLFNLKIERELRDEFKKKFRGKMGEMLNWFIFEAVKMRSRMVFDMKYSGEPSEVPGKTWVSPFGLNRRAVIGSRIDTGEEVGRWVSCTAAAIEMGTTKFEVSRCCRGKRKDVDGILYVFDETPISDQEMIDFQKKQANGFHKSASSKKRRSSRKKKNRSRKRV